jgi:hypothetical protein
MSYNQLEVAAADAVRLRKIEWVIEMMATTKMSKQMSMYIKHRVLLPLMYPLWVACIIVHVSIDDFDTAFYAAPAVVTVLSIIVSFYTAYERRYFVKAIKEVPVANFEIGFCARDMTAEAVEVDADA